MGAFVDAFVAELDPGDSVILRQAALDVADKAWRLSRAQRWEAEGYSASDHAPEQARRARWLRELARRGRRHAAAVRLFPDPDVSPDDLTDALCSLSLDVGLLEEDLDWVDEVDPASVASGLATLVDERFGDQEDAATYLDGRASEREAEASALESYIRPEVIRREIDGSFARNAERLVSHASREYDRSLRRYKELFEHYAVNDTDGADQDWYEDGVDSQPDRGTDGGAADEMGIWSRMTADEVVDSFKDQLTANGTEPPPRNEPANGNADM